MLIIPNLTMFNFAHFVFGVEKLYFNHVKFGLATLRQAHADNRWINLSPLYKFNSVVLRALLFSYTITTFCASTNEIILHSISSMANLLMLLLCNRVD